MALSSGASLGVYRIGELIGKGGMGEVYRAGDDTHFLARARRTACPFASGGIPSLAAGLSM